ncbi:MAG: hypothetical protein R3F65_01990 [bacterium]|nr:hypothetical protein [Myxococcales bacterium]MCB9541085.1 hypothetical protein [Myxococcales bacterium]MCB9551662.1 hypothetical protein [Myxococcales bacterium]
MPHLTPRRGDALVWYRQDLDVEAALGWLAERNRDREPADRLTLFHLVLHAIAGALHERPALNRFVRGGRLWQRDGIWLSFSAKLAMSDDAPITTIKRRIDPAWPIEALADAVLPPLRATRRGEPTATDKELGLLLRLPGPLIRLGLAVASWLDHRGLLPRAMIEPDPLFASAFVANLGSVGLDAGYHHLWEWGTCSIFCVIGRIHEGPGGKRRVTLKWTYDERVADGFYAARALERVQRRIEAPG